MKLDHALLDQALQQLVCTVVGWLFGILTRTLSRRRGPIRRRSDAEPPAQDQADS